LELRTLSSKKTDHGVDGHLGGFVGVAQGSGILDGGGDHLAQRGAEGVGVFNALLEEAGAQNDGEDLLEGHGEIVCPDLGKWGWRCCHADVSVRTVRSKVASPRSPGR
jgi:hypothetical protein